MHSSERTSVCLRFTWNGRLGNRQPIFATQLIAMVDPVATAPGSEFFSPPLGYYFHATSVLVELFSSTIHKRAQGVDVGHVVRRQFVRSFQDECCVGQPRVLRHAPQRLAADVTLANV